MPRSKVPQERRIRVAQACDYCKTKKLKCNGSQPCNNCLRRNIQCYFLPKHRIRDRRSIPTLDNTRDRDEGILTGAPSGNARVSFPTATAASAPSNSLDSMFTPFEGISPVLPDHSLLNMSPTSLAAQNTKGSTLTCEAESFHVAIPIMSDERGRAVFYGESCSLAYLGTICTFVQTATGVEASATPLSLPDSPGSPDDLGTSQKCKCLLPPIEATVFLVDSFLSYTQGAFAFFDQPTFMAKVNETYKHPLSAEFSWLCTLNIVLATGLQLFPQQDPANSAKLNEFGLTDPLQADLFFANGSRFREMELKTGTASCALLEAMSLATLYLVTAGKRNAAFINHGTAVQLSHMLGLHGTNTNVSELGEAERGRRTTIWRNLYIMDRLISALSGRPPAIHDSYCFDSLISRASQFQQRAKSGEVGELDILSLSALSARLLGIITEKIYHTGDRSIQCAVDITLDLHSWVQSLPPYLRIWDPDCVHINHVPSSVQVNLWLVHFYSVTLLTWPFLVTCIKKTIIQKRSALACPEGNDHDSLMVKKFAEACVRSATQIIKTIRAMRDRCVVSDREPFTISWLFIAALVLLSNSIFKIFDNPEGAKDIDDAIRLQRESAMTKHHAKVYQSFLTRLQQLLVPDKPSDDLLMSTSSIIETLASSQYPQGTFAGGELPIMGATDAPLLEGFLNSSEDFSLPSVLGLDPTANWLFGYGHMDIN